MGHAGKHCRSRHSLLSRRAIGERRLCIESLEARQALSATPTMVADANDADAHLSMDAQQLTVVGDVLYFSANVDGGGAGLWRSDGTVEGTVLVKEIPRLSSYPVRPHHLANVGGSLFFWTSENNDYSLWTSDGSESGTLLVRNFGQKASYNVSHFGSNWVELNGHSYFTVNDGFSGAELWKSDGTVAGTVQAADIRKGAAGSSPRLLGVLDGALYFAADSGGPSLELWRTDGTNEGAIEITEFPGTSKYLGDVTTTGDRFYFSFNDGSRGIELWTTDGTASGTTLVKDILPPSPYDYSKHVSGLVNVGGVIYFTANPGDTREVWRTDGTETGTYRVSTPGAPTATRLTNVNGSLYFLTGSQIWTNDGTVGGSSLVVAPPVTSIGYLMSANGVLYFSASGPSQLPTLWKSDGTAQGTHLIEEISLGVAPTHYRAFTTIGDSLFFAAEDPINGGQQLWRTEGGDGTKVDLLNPSVNGTLSGFPANPTVVGDWMYYTSRSGTHWTSLWKTDGRNAALVKNLRPLPTSHYERRPVEMVNVSGTLYFTATDGEHGYELWKSDGTEAGTVMVKDANTADQSLEATAPGILTNVGGTLFFLAKDPTFYDTTVWKSDGTEEGTKAVSGGPSYAHRLMELDGELYILAGLSQYSQLWKTDGTGTEQVTPYSLPLSVNYRFPVVSAGGLLHFVVKDATKGDQLWTSDGTAAGTKAVKNLAATKGWSEVDWLWSVGGKAYVGIARQTGYQLWSTDGTPAGTELILSSPESSYRTFTPNFTAHGGYIYFTAGGGFAHPEKTVLWRTDGTAAGTSIAAELSSEKLLQVYLATADDRLYLLGRPDHPDANHTVMWENPQEFQGTPQLLDGVLLSPGYEYENSVTTFKSNIYFSASDGEHGEELWRLLPPATLAGDYTDDGVVDGADFLSWQRSFGAAVPTGSGADGDGNGTVGAGDLDVWRENFAAPGGITAASRAVVSVAALVAEEEESADAGLETSLRDDAEDEGFGRDESARKALFAAGDFSWLFPAGGDDGAKHWRRWRGRAPLARRG